MKKISKTGTVIIIAALVVCAAAFLGCSGSGASSASSSSVSSSPSSASSSSTSSSSVSQPSSRQASQSSAGTQSNKYHISTADFDFDVPEYWQGKVDWEVRTARDGRSQVVFFLPGTGTNSYGGHDGELLELSVQKVDDPRTAGDYLTQTTFINMGDKTVCSTATNWIAYAFDKEHHPEYSADMSLTQDQVSELIDLATEGEYTLEQARSLQELAGDDISFIAHHIRDSIVAPNISVH